MIRSTFWNRLAAMLWIAGSTACGASPDTVVFNQRSLKIHHVDCEAARTCTNCTRLPREQALARGGSPCRICHPVADSGRKADRREALHNAVPRTPRPKPGPPLGFEPGATVEVGFSPDAGALDLILAAVASAKTRILVATYSFTSKPVSLALLEAHRKGIEVKVVSDAGEVGKSYSAVTFLANQGVPVRANGRYAIHHHKFMVIDGRHVQTGSFNYSAAAAHSNAENALLLREVPALAARYAAEWQRLWDEAEPVKPRY